MEIIEQAGSNVIKIGHNIISKEDWRYIYAYADARIDEIAKSVGNKVEKLNMEQVEEMKLLISLQEHCEEKMKTAKFREEMEI